MWVWGMLLDLLKQRWLLLGSTCILTKFVEPSYMAIIQDDGLDKHIHGLHTARW